MEWMGKLLLIGHRIYEENNEEHAVDEEQAEVKVEDPEDNEESEGSVVDGLSILTRGLKFSSADDFHSFMGDDKAGTSGKFRGTLNTLWPIVY